MLFDYYDYVSTVAKYQNISQAAKELYMSQSTLSRTISRLEDNLGVALFDRAHSPLRLTEAGKYYLNYAVNVKELEKKMLKELDRLAPERKSEIVMGFPLSYACDILPYILPEFYKQYPNTKIVVKEMSGGLLGEQLLKHNLDLAIIADTSFPSNLHCEYLETQRILLVVPYGHPLYYEMSGKNYAALNINDMQKLNNEAFIALAPNEGMRIVSDNFFDNYHIKPNIIMEVPDTATAYSLAVSGLALTLVSELRVLLKTPNIPNSKYCCYQLGNPPFTRTRVIAYPKNSTLSPAEEYLTELARKNIGKLYMHAEHLSTID